MKHRVTSRFSIFSEELGPEELAHHFPWRMVGSRLTEGDPKAHHVSYDIGCGEHDRVDNHLEAVRRALMQHETQLIKLAELCRYVIWLKYEHPPKQGAMNIPREALSGFGHLRTEIIIQINDFEYEQSVEPAAGGFSPEDGRKTSA